MNTKAILLATLAGGLAYFLLGFLVYGLALQSMLSLPPEVESVIGRDPMNMIAMFASCVVWALILAIIFERWAGITTILTGLKAGALLGFLFSLSVDLGMGAMYNFVTIENTVVDVLANTVITSLTGGVIGWVLGKTSGRLD